MKTAYSYQRWSTALQGKEGKDSKSRQTKSSTDWIQNYGKGHYLLSDEVFIDAGKSAYKGKHIESDEYGKAKGELLRFIELVEKGTIEKGSLLLIDSYDRFSRLKPTKSLGLFVRVIECGIGLVFTGSYHKGVIDSAAIDSEPNLLQFIIGEMIRSYSESAEKSRKIIAALQSKKQKMQAGAIVNYNNIPKYFTFDKSSGRYIHNDNTTIVKALVNSVLDGKSLYKMADDLNARKVKTFRWGFQWSGNSIRQILRNRTLIGEYLGNKNFVPPIIDVETFNKVQIVLNNNLKYNRGKRGELVNIFRGICLCADCGKAMTIGSQTCNDVKYRYLRCSVGGLGRNTACQNKRNFRLDDMETEFFFEFLSKDPYELLNPDNDTEVKALSCQIAAKQLESNRLDTEVKQCVELLGITQMDELKSKLLALDKARSAVKAELNSLYLKVSVIQNATKNSRMTMSIIDERGENFVYTDTYQKIEEALKDNENREKVRVLLPNLLGKITVDTIKGQFVVYNRLGNIVYQSRKQESQRNKSLRWTESLKLWTVRHCKDKTITVKRKPNGNVNPVTKVRYLGLGKV